MHRKGKFMERLIDNTYKLPKPNINKLSELGFRYDRKLSTSEQAVYYYKFPVLKYKEYTTLECEISINTSNEYVDINVYDENGNMYFPFYHNEYGNHEPLIKKINKKINSELKRIGIVKIKS